MVEASLGDEADVALLGDDGLTDSTPREEEPRRGHLESVLDDGID